MFQSFINEKISDRREPESMMKLMIETSVNNRIEQLNSKESKFFGTFFMSAR